MRFVRFIFDSILNIGLISALFLLYGCNKKNPFIEKATSLKAKFLFDKSSATLKDSDKVKIATVGFLMCVNRNIEIIITGYSSNSKTSDPQVISLRQQRANAVYNYLKKIYPKIINRVSIDNMNNIGNNPYPIFPNKGQARCAIISVKVTGKSTKFPQVQIGQEEE